MNASRLAAWLRRIPERATRCEIRWDSVNGKQSIASYTRPDLEREGVEELLRATQDHCDDLGSSRARYEIVWLDDDGQVLSTKAIVCDLSSDGDAERDDRTIFENVKTEDASSHGLTIALMRHLEVRERMYHSGMAVVVRTAMDTLRDQRGENSELRSENRTLRQQLRRSSERGGDGDQSEADTAETVARAEAWNKVTDAFTQLVLPQLMRNLETKH
jgi:hypothetical protein